MRIKQDFDLIYRGSSGVFNIYTGTTGTLDAYAFDIESKNYLLTLSRSYARSRGVQFDKYISSYLDTCLFVNMPSYPLPGFITRKNVPVVNLGVLKASDITDYLSADIYTAAAYTLLFKNYIDNKSFSEPSTDLTSLFIFNVFMTLFGKKHGLIGSYSNLIPKLRFLIEYYVRSGLLGLRLNESELGRMASSYSIGLNSLNLKYDFSNIKEFIQSLNENEILPLSINKFSMSLINVAGINSLPVFEDIARMYSTLLCSSIKGNNIFSVFWIKSSKNIFNKMLYFGMKKLR